MNSEHNIQLCMRCALPVVTIMALWQLLNIYIHFHDMDPHRRRSSCLHQNSRHPIHPHVSPFLTSTSPSRTVTSKQISILNLRTNISTSYTLHVTPYIPNEPSHPASLSDYDVYALPTRPSHYEQTNLYNISTTVDTISLSSNTKYNVFTHHHTY